MDDALKHRDARVLVLSSKLYEDTEHVCRTLDKFAKKYGISRIILTGVPGANRASDWWARQRNVSITVLRVPPSKVVESARADVVLSFPGDTASTLQSKRALELKVTVYQIKARKDDEPG